MIKMMKLAILFVVGVIASQTYGDAPERIVGGQSATIGQFPYQVSLQMLGLHTCGGSIISPTYIITAAHCVDNPGYNKYLSVVTSTIIQPKVGKKYEIEDIFIHEGYNGKLDNFNNLRHDIALLRMKVPIIFDSLQSPIPLATKDYATGSYRGIISGWGKTTVTSDASLDLKWLSVGVLSQTSCMNSHKRPQVTKEQICTLEKVGKGACQGDSGGPLMINGELCGLTSWVMVPCGSGQADIFTSVYHYRNWIAKYLQLKP